MSQERRELEAQAARTAWWAGLLGGLLWFAVAGTLLWAVLHVRWVSPDNPPALNR